MRAEPERAGPILDDDVHEIPRDAGDVLGQDEAMVRPTRQAVPRIHQGRAIGAAGQPDPPAWETVVRGERLEGAVHEAGQSVSRLRPDAAFPVLEDVAGEVASEAVPLG